MHSKGQEDVDRETLTARMASIGRCTEVRSMLCKPGVPLKPDERRRWEEVLVCTLRRALEASFEFSSGGKGDLTMRVSLPTEETTLCFEYRL